MKLYCLLVSLLLASEANSQEKAKAHRLVFSAGISWQYLSPIFSWATLNTQNASNNKQLSVSYNLPFREGEKGLSVNPEIALRSNSAELTYQTPIGDTFVRTIHGSSSQILLPVKYRFREFALSIGLFAELPLSLRIKEVVNQAGSVDWFPNIDEQISQISKGLQVSTEYNWKRLQLRLFVAKRSEINRGHNLLIPSSQLQGCYVGYKF